MKRIKITPVRLLLAAGIMAVAGLSSCGNKTAGATADSDTVAAETEVAEVPTDTLAAFFSNDSLESATPTDTTWTKTASGLKYAILKEGNGISPKATDNVTVHYTGRLLDGTIFDSSVDRGEPIMFPLTAVIKGWTEGLQLMKEGGRAVFYLPSDLAYGEMGTPNGPIPPNAPLIFEVELIKVN